MALVLTESVLFYWDCVDYVCHQSGQGSAKDDWAGIGDWADKLTSTKALAILSQRFTSNSHHTRSVSSSSLSSLITPASISTRVSAPRSLPPSDPQDSNSYIHGNDEAECNAMSNPTAKAVTTRQTGSMGIVEIVSSSELDELSPPPPPTPKSCIPYKKGSTKGHTTQQAPRLKGKRSIKRTQSDQNPSCTPIKTSKDSTMQYLRDPALRQWSQ
ncbi:hypothetical protein PAXRUDRAFT_20076 [Paxillus rubicundulus Ve08.2h10]|uniref:Uncharacterized protein n=1 Tax=Paxillus rubicundulus Ve08.2h10 TaxID=930991 RepID=A0A0D0BRY2_9AGAM|nr:hypothetical protein PAXRUDRAFT_20076 [Paxillus rubicundulus Ve08.2h10]